MRNIILSAVLLTSCTMLNAQDAEPSKDKTAPAQTGQKELESKFKEQLTNARFAGSWSPLKNGELGEAKSDKYTIQSAVKSGNDVWLIYARIDYGGKQTVIPVPVQVKWAGDTPVIVLDKVSIPGLGTYSARVMIYESTYSGVWSAGDHGGVLQGVIQKNPETGARAFETK